MYYKVSFQPLKCISRNSLFSCRTELQPSYFCLCRLSVSHWATWHMIVSHCDHTWFFPLLKRLKSSNSESKQQRNVSLSKYFGTPLFTALHSFSHTFFLSWTAQLKQVEPENHRAFTTEHADCPVLACGVGHEWHGRRGRRQTSGGWTGGDATAASRIHRWMGGRGRGGAVLCDTFTPREVVTKVATWCHSRYHTQAGRFFNLFNQHKDTRWWEGSYANK